MDQEPISFVSESTEIARRIQSFSIDDGELDWLGFNLDHDSLKPSVSVLDRSLYSGQAELASSPL